MAADLFKFELKTANKFSSMTKNYSNKQKNKQYNEKQEEISF